MSYKKNLETSSIYLAEFYQAIFDENLTYQKKFEKISETYNEFQNAIYSFEATKNYLDYNDTYNNFGKNSEHWNFIRK